MAKGDESGEKAPAAGAPSPALQPRTEAKIPLREAVLGFRHSEWIALGGLAVFVIACVCGVIFLLISGLTAQLYSGDGSWMHLRVVELLLMTASLGIVVTIMAASQYWFVYALGVMLIGALIVPSRDMVRFALLVSNSDKTLEDLYPTSVSNAEFQGRDSDLAAKILSGIELDDDSQRLFGSGPAQDIVSAPATASGRSVASRTSAFKSVDLTSVRIRLRRLIEDAIFMERIITVAERIRLRGVTGPLAAIGAGPDKFIEYSYRYGREDTFVPALVFLRDQGVIDFDFNDIRAAKATLLGSCVAHHLTKLGTPPDGCPKESEAQKEQPSEQRSAAVGRRNLILNDLDETVAGLVRIVLEQCDDAAVNFPGNLPIIRATQSVDNVAELRQFQLPSQMTATLNLKDGSENGRADSDPFLVLFRVVDAICMPFDYNDDDSEGADGTLNSKLIVILEPGNYIVFSGNRGDLLRDYNFTLTYEVAPPSPPPDPR